MCISWDYTFALFLGAFNLFQATFLSCCKYGKYFIQTEDINVGSIIMYVPVYCHWNKHYVRGYMSPEVTPFLSFLKGHELGLQIDLCIRKQSLCLMLYKYTCQLFLLCCKRRTCIQLPSLNSKMWTGLPVRHLPVY